MAPRLLRSAWLLVELPTLIAVSIVANSSAPCKFCALVEGILDPTKQAEFYYVDTPGKRSYSFQLSLYETRVHTHVFKNIIARFTSDFLARYLKGNATLVDVAERLQSELKLVVEGGGGLKPFRIEAADLTPNSFQFIVLHAHHMYALSRDRRGPTGNLTRVHIVEIRSVERALSLADVQNCGLQPYVDELAMKAVTIPRGKMAPDLEWDIKQSELHTYFENHTLDHYGARGLGKIEARSWRFLSQNATILDKIKKVLRTSTEGDEANSKTMENYVKRFVQKNYKSGRFNVFHVIPTLAKLPNGAFELRLRMQNGWLQNEASRLVCKVCENFAGANAIGVDGYDELTLDEILSNAARIAETLFLLQLAGIILRDWSAVKFMKTADNKYLMGGFGSAIILGDPQTDYVTDKYPHPSPEIAPEAIKGERQNFQVDVWAFGIRLYTLFLLAVDPDLPEHGDEDDDEESNSGDDNNSLSSDDSGYEFQAPYNAPAFATPTGRMAKDLLKRMLNPNPQLRITIDKVLTHKWFKSQNFHFKHLLHSDEASDGVDRARPPTPSI